MANLYKENNSLTYSSTEQFVMALQNHRPKIVFSSHSHIPLTGHAWNHYFAAHSIVHHSNIWSETYGGNRSNLTERRGWEAEKEAIDSVVRELGAKDVAGKMFHDADGRFYQIFDAEGYRQRSQQTYDAWLDNLKSEINPQNVELWYLQGHPREDPNEIAISGLSKTPRGHIIDAVHGQEHRIVILDGKESRNIENALN